MEDGEPLDQLCHPRVGYSYFAMAIYKVLVYTLVALFHFCNQSSVGNPNHYYLDLRVKIRVHIPRKSFPPGPTSTRTKCPILSSLILVFNEKIIIFIINGYDNMFIKGPDPCREHNPWAARLAPLQRGRYALSGPQRTGRTIAWIKLGPSEMMFTRVYII